MFAYTLPIVAEAEAIAARGGSVTEALRLLRALSIDDFGELMLLMPDARFPALSGLLPRMADSQVQRDWTGSGGYALLGQTATFVRFVDHAYRRLLGRELTDARILDFGCGYGRILRLMLRFTSPDRLFACDPWDRSIELCREDGVPAVLAQSDYLPRTLPFANVRFELIYAFSVFTHLSERAVRTALIALRKSIADGGLLIITIRPVEYWARSGRTAEEAGRLVAIHERDSFAFDPHIREAVEGDVTYGDTSMTLGWLEATAADCGWRIAGLDRSLGDPFQIILYLRPSDGT